MQKQEIKIEAESLDEAKTQIQSNIPEGQKLLSETVISDGKPITVRTVADTIETAIKEARSRIPANSTVLDEQVISAPRKELISVEAFDGISAKTIVQGQLGKADASLKAIKLAAAGRKGIFGLGKKPNRYEADVLFKAVVEVTYKTKAVISILVGEPPGVDEKDYLRRCMEPKYKEQEESRSWDSEPAFRKVLDPLNSGDYSRTCSEASALAARFGDFADLYYWWGKALLGIQEFDKARSMLTAALEKTKQKHPICNLLGEIEWKAGNIAEAVYWWSQGVHCQESLSGQNFGGDVGAYLYLYYVADALGLSDCASAFVMRVDQIRPGKIRLNSESASDLSSLALAIRSRHVPEVLRQLVSTYIVPKKATTKADPNEVDRLIRQLEERDSLGWSSERNVEAAKRLGELGDPRAIEPLTRAMRDLSLSLQVAAEEAIKKIKRPINES